MTTVTAWRYRAASDLRAGWTGRHRGTGRTKRARPSSPRRQADVAGADRVPGLGVDLGEADQAPVFVGPAAVASARPAWRAGGPAARGGGGTAGRPAARRGGEPVGGVLGDEDGVEDPDYLLVDPGRRARDRFRRSHSHPGMRRRDINGSYGHGAASFGQRYKSRGSRGDLLPCWAHEKTSFILVPGEVPKSLSVESFPPARHWSRCFRITTAST